MSNYGMVRLLDSYFRHPVLHLLPLVLLAAVGSYYVLNQERSFQSTGSLVVEDATMLTSLTELGGRPPGGYLTAAEYASQQLNSLLQTDAFVLDVAEAAGVGDRTEIGGQAVGELRESIGSWTHGDNIMHVSAFHERAKLAQSLAEAAINQFLQWQIDADVTQSTVAEDVLGPLTRRYERELAEARTALEEYLIENPVPADEARPSSEQLVVDELTASVSKASTRYSEALDKTDTARLAAAQAQADVRSRLQLLDVPQLPEAPMQGLRTGALTLAKYLAAGAVMVMISVVVGAVTDQTLRFPKDVEKLGGVTLVATLPDAKPTRPRRTGLFPRSGGRDDASASASQGEDDLLKVLLGDLDEVNTS